jgi:phospholipid/cholesterol/gamma-HCH transport system ATP-binding protein
MLPHEPAKDTCSMSPPPESPQDDQNNQPKPAKPAKTAASESAAPDRDEIIVIDSDEPAAKPATTGAKPHPGDELPDGKKVMLEVQHIHKSFGDKKVLVDLSLKVRQRETLCVVGGSGCGKSTLLRVMCGLTEPDETADGQVLIGGQNILTGNRQELDQARGRLGMVFQYAALLASYSVFENVALPLLEKGEMKRPEIRERVADVLEKVHLPGTEDLMPSELSGGMRKRVGIARAIVTQPDVILFDEPTSGLDPIMTAIFDELVIELRSTLQLTSVIVSHDLQSVYRVAHRIVMLHQGHMIIDTTSDHFQQSDNPAVRQFVRGETTGPLVAD